MIVRGRRRLLKRAALGAEFPGAVLLASRVTDLSRAEEGVAARVLLEGNVAQEAAHPWFFGTVGSGQVREPWLDEGLAHYATLLYYRERYGHSAAEQARASFERRGERVGKAAVPSCSCWPSRRSWGRRASAGCCASSPAAAAGGWPLETGSWRWPRSSAAAP